MKKLFSSPELPLVLVKVSYLEYLFLPNVSIDPNHYWNSHGQSISQIWCQSDTGVT